MKIETESMIAILVFLMLLQPGPLSAVETEPISIGYSQTLHSKVLGEDRRIFIHLPRGYADSRTSYPVVYHLYGDRIEQYFAEAVATVYNMSSGGDMPGVVLVGIDENDLRYRDLLPMSNSGEETRIDEFTKYLNDELFPFIDKTFRTKDYRILVGPQVGANFGLYTLFTSPGMFDAYILNNPFRWTGGRDLLFEHIQEFSEKEQPLRAFLFINHRETDDLEKASRVYIRKFDAIIARAGFEGFRFHLQHLADSTDFISPTGLADGLHKLFATYRIAEGHPINNLDDLQDYYAAASRDIGFEIDIPSLTLLLNSDRLMNEGATEASLQILEYGQKHYPSSPNFFGRVGNYYKKSGNYSQALVYYQRAFDILPIPYFSSKLEDVKALLSAETNEE